MSVRDRAWLGFTWGGVLPIARNWARPYQERADMDGRYERIQSENSSVKVLYSGSAQHSQGGVVHVCRMILRRCSHGEEKRVYVD